MIIPRSMKIRLAANMLQQILTDMYIDPELLEELPEEQKQFLFFKMREEQVRRWMVREKELAEKETANTNGARTNVEKRSVSFMKGVDGNDWVWVMGDHEKDRSIEQILEEEAEAKALKLAELEIQKELALEKERRAKEKEEALRRERETEAERLKFEAEEKIRLEELEKEKMRKEEEELKLKKEQEEKELLKKEAEEKERKKQEEEEARDNKALEEEAKLKANKLSSSENSSGNDSPRTRSDDRKGMSGVALRRKSCDADERLRKMIMRRSREILFDFKSIRAKFEENAKKDGKELKRHWRAQELKSKAAEEEIKQASLRVREAHQKSIRSPINAMMAIQLLQAQPSVSPEEESTPEPTPRKPRAKLKPLPASPTPDAVQSPLSSTERPPVPPRPRVTRRPMSRQAAANWFQRHQKPRGAVVDPDNHRVSPWFHGLITRPQAEAVLEECPQGTFLLRLSERLFGYAVSVRGEHRCKHFLVEAMPPGGYRLFGLGQHPLHRSLHEFVKYHTTNPLSVFGRELLVEPVSQTALTKKEAAEADSSAAFIELFPEIASENVMTAF